jgi:hypothetical protein
MNQILVDKLPGPAGFLRIWKKKDGVLIPHEMGGNMILKVYRDNLAALAKDDDGFDSESNSLFDPIIPVEVVFDNQGSEILGDGTEHVFTPSETDEILDTADNYYLHDIDSKGYGESTNIMKSIIRIKQDEANGLTFSRAMLVAKDGSPVALKCFESLPKKQSWEFILEWSIAY